MIRAEDWEPAGGLLLEQNALAAVRQQDHNVVVVAGPGAGKTELLAQRADFLFRARVSPYPRRILAISFKVDAARNLQSRVRLRSGARFAARFDSFTFHAFAKRLIDNYRPTLTGQRALHRDYRIDAVTRIPGEQITFDDLVPLALEILASNKYARGALRQTYSHVFLDEFQDATELQYKLLRQAFGGTEVRITAVGDMNQRIMVFAGALEGVMARFASDFGATRLQLYQNYRSRPRLRRMQNRMILNMDPDAASPSGELLGDEGTILVLPFDTDLNEAAAIADLIATWLSEGVQPSEITVLVRQQPHFVAAALVMELASRGIAHRNEQQAQDLTAEPAAALVFNFLRVIASDQNPNSYSELFRVVTKGDSVDQDGVLDSRLRKLLANNRMLVRSAGFSKSEALSWKPLVSEFLQLVTRASLSALSPSYQQGTRLSDVVNDAFSAFKRELEVDGEPVATLNRLSEVDAIRILTVHKCKGLEFEKVIVLGVETQLFWGSNKVEVMSEFFVAISRAKSELVLTHADWRSKPNGASHNWKESRTAHAELLEFGNET